MAKISGLIRRSRFIARVLFIALTLCCTLVARAEVSLTLGVISERPERPGEALETYGPFKDYLAQHLAGQGIHVRNLVIARDLNEMVERINNGKVDALIEGVMPTLLIQRRTNKIEPSLLVWRKGQREYYTVFFVRRESPINSLKGLARKLIAFESGRSTSAFFVPSAELESEGLHPVPNERNSADPNAVHYVFAGSELNQAYWVEAGRVDAGAFNDGDWERTPETLRRNLRIIGRTRPVIRWLVSFFNTLDANVRETVSDVLVTMDQDSIGLAALRSASEIAKLERLSEEDRSNLAYWSSVLPEID